jgi:Uma2 family endonuclease
MTTASWPDHLLTLTEWDTLSEDTSRRCELVEGVLLVVPRPAPLHQRAMVRLTSELDRQLPDHLTALADVEVLVNTRYPATVRVPDVVVVQTSTAQGNPPRLVVADVLVAVEIVSPGTGRTDRVTKLTEYADAGIPHYWLVELEKPTTLTAYFLVDGDYEHVAGGTGLISILEPAPVKLDLGALTSRR